jgi:hypothetical protein
MSEKINADNCLMIDTPDNTVATYVYTDEMNNRIFHDGLAYWCIDKDNDNKIEYYD